MPEEHRKRIVTIIEARCVPSCSLIDQEHSELCKKGSLFVLVCTDYKECKTAEQQVLGQICWQQVVLLSMRIQVFAHEKSWEEGNLIEIPRPPSSFKPPECRSVLHQLQAAPSKNEKVCNSTCSMFCLQHKTCLQGGFLEALEALW